MSRIAAAVFVALLAQTAYSQEQNPGYTDTPVLPDGFRVHDAMRPRPPAIDPGPGPKVPTPAPKDAIVLFDRALAIERSDERLLDARCDHTPMLLPSCAALGHTAVSARDLLLPKLSRAL